MKRQKQVVLMALLFVMSLLAASCGGSETTETAQANEAAAVEGTPAPDAGEAVAPAATAAVEEATTEEDSAAQAEPRAGTVTVVATEYDFDLPATLPAGKTTFRLVNRGKEPHALSLALATKDAPPATKLVKLNPQEVEQKYLEGEVQFTGADPGKTADHRLKVDLIPGRRYVYACFLNSPDGKFHYEFGQFGEFTVE